MSVLSNPASRAPEHARAYIAAILDLLGGEDPLTVLGGTAAAIRRTLDELPAAALVRPEAPGKWSIRDVVQHLADCELVWGYRMRMVLAQDRPALTGFDQDLWASRLGYAEVDAADALEVFTALRRANLRLLARATESDLQRAGVHAERGEERVDHMMRLNAGHDLAHLRQIARIRATRPG